jgi:ribonuclease HI
METALTIYTDGGCSGNPGPGGWAYVLVPENSRGSTILAEQYGGEKKTTNNRMELRAVIESLKAVKILDNVQGKVVLYTDSQYVQKGITDWIRKWKQNAWQTSDKKPVKNKDLWMELDTLIGELKHQGTELGWKWIRGHAGNEYNERCDRMTQEAIRRAQWD